MTKEIVQGQRFSLVYLQHKESFSDSQRMRQRVSALFYELGIHDYKPSNYIQKELGVKVPFLSSSYYYEKFFLNCEIRDLLDCITLFFNIMTESNETYKKATWAKEVERIFQEENVSYFLDARCGVHLKVDNEFEHNYQSVIKGLNEKRYKAIYKAFISAKDYLDEVPPDGRKAMNAVFDSLETLFKLMFPDVTRLGKKEVKDKLSPCVEYIYNGNSTAIHSMNKMVNSFAEWIDGMHFYRHAQGTETPIQPPLSLSVMSVSIGASYLRWLAELDGLAQTQDRI